MCFCVCVCWLVNPKLLSWRMATFYHGTMREPCPKLLYISSDRSKITCPKHYGIPSVYMYWFINTAWSNHNFHDPDWLKEPERKLRHCIGSPSDKTCPEYTLFQVAFIEKSNSHQTIGKHYQLHLCSQLPFHQPRRTTNARVHGTLDHTQEFSFSPPKGWKEKTSKMMWNRFFVHSNSTVDLLVKHQLGFVDVHLISWFYQFNSRGIDLGPSPKPPKHGEVTIMATPLWKSPPCCPTKRMVRTFISKEPLLFRSSKKEPWDQTQWQCMCLCSKKGLFLLGKTSESFHSGSVFFNQSALDNFWRKT